MAKVVLADDNMSHDDNNDLNSRRDTKDLNGARDDPGNSVVNDKALSHCQAMIVVKRNITELLSDPLLSGIAKDITLEELQDVLHLEQGKAITLYLKRYDDSILR